MKSAVYNTFSGAIEIKQVDDPVVTETEAIIELRASRICRSDWHGWKGHDPDIRLPHVPGHEFSGIRKLLTVHTIYLRVWYDYTNFTKATGNWVRLHDWDKTQMRVRGTTP